ncbi:Phosphonoacetaldehyde hydrolase [compost metagenome]
MWTVALRFSGNFLGLSWDEYQALPAERRATERARIDDLFSGSRPHYLIDTIAELPAVIDHINARLARGESPQAC